MPRIGLHLLVPSTAEAARGGTVLAGDEREIVRRTWALAAADPDAAAELFYGRLFEVAPELKALFPDDLKEQGRKLMRMIHLAVQGLDRPETLVPVLEALGRRHVAYGVAPEHYPVVGQCLLWTLETALGEQFGPAAREGWAKTYALLAGTMQGA
jgi:hemoglobin-like flavoprotein